VGRAAEDEQFKRGTALDAAGFDLSRPDRNTARIFGRLYELPDVTAAVVRELTHRNYAPTSTAPDAGSSAGKESEMETTQTDPNKDLNGQQPAPQETGFFATARSYCTVKNGAIAAAVLVVGTAVYLYVTGGTDIADVATPTA
jgi:hypothetical protein